MSGCGCEFEARNRSQTRVLRWLLLINAGMFLVEGGAGWLSDSTALIADSLDMLADATVYGIGLYAVGRGLHTKARAALVSGMFQILLGLGVLGDVLRRILVGSTPEPAYMLGIGLLALLANLICLYLISHHRDGEIHMRASWIFSKNDVIANLGVIAGGVLVQLLDTNLPDLMIGAAIAILVGRGGIFIIKDSLSEFKTVQPG